jgi:hypothetical protein
MDMPFYSTGRLVNGSSGIARTHEAGSREHGPPWLNGDTHKQTVLWPCGVYFAEPSDTLTPSKSRSGLKSDPVRGKSKMTPMLSIIIRRFCDWSETGMSPDFGLVSPRSVKWQHLMRSSCMMGATTGQNLAPVRNG